MYISNRIKNIQQSKLRKHFEKAPQNSINFGLGEIQFDTPRKLTEYANSILSSDKIRYTPNAGLPELRKQIAHNYDIKYNNNVCVTVGAQEAIFATIFSYINKNDEVLIANPSFVAYETIVRMCEGKPVFFDLDPTHNFAINTGSLEKSISNKTRMLILNNPSNPLGITFSDEEIEFIISICEKNEIILVVDEIYRELYLDKEIPSFIGYSENVIVISGLSKSHCMTGWRIGWCISQNSKLIEPIINAHQYICTCAPYLSQKVAIKTLSKRDNFSDEIRFRLKHNYEIITKTLKTNFPELKLLTPSSSPYLFINIEADDTVFAEELLSEKLVVIPGSIFGSNGKNWIRLNYGLDEKLLMKGLLILINKIKLLTN